MWDTFGAHAQTLLSDSSLYLLCHHIRGELGRGSTECAYAWSTGVSGSWGSNGPHTIVCVCVRACVCVCVCVWHIEMARTLETKGPLLQSRAYSIGRWAR